MALVSCSIMQLVTEWEASLLIFDGPTSKQLLSLHFAALQVQAERAIAAMRVDLVRRN